MNGMCVRHEMVRSILGVAVIVLAGASSARGDLLVHIDFEDGKAVGTTITNTTNRGTAGGTATGTVFTAGALTYTAGPRGERRDRAALFVDANTGSGTAVLGGRVLFTLPVDQIATDSDWTFAAAVYVGDGNIGYDRVVDPFITMAGEFDLSVMVTSSGGQVTLLDSTYAFHNNWRHIVITSDYDGSANLDRQYAKVYLDGVLVGSAPFGVRFNFSGGITFSLGSQPGGGRPFDGMVDDVRFYNVLLSPEEVYQLYADVMIIPPPPGTVLSIQ